MTRVNVLFRILCLSLLILPATAFFPTILYSVFGLLGTSHEKITLDALEVVRKEFFPKSAVTAEVETAFETVADANANVDADEKYDAYAHFDGESFPEGQARLQRLRGEIKSTIAAGDVDGARKRLGMCLHSIQDFYSHTNWVEMGNTEIHPKLGRDGTIERTEKTYPTCITCKNWLFKSSTKLRNLDVKCANACKFGDETTPAMAATIVCTRLCAAPVCDANLIAGNALTSGYFSDEVGFEKPGSHKCSHGGPFDGSAEGLEGINKDTHDGTFSPHGPKFHHKAVGLARKATERFIRDLYLRDGVTLEQLGKILGVNDAHRQSGAADAVLLAVNDDSVGLRRRSAETFTFTVDASISDISLDASPGTTLIQPDGTPYAPTGRPRGARGARGARDGHIRIPGPQQGVWKVLTTSPHVSVTGTTDLRLSNFRLLEFKGRPGHTGFFPLHGDVNSSGEETFNLRPNTNILALARFSHKEITSATFELVDSSGRKLNAFVQDTWKKGNETEGVPGNVWWGNFTVPEGELHGVRVFVSGKWKGKGFRRGMGRGFGVRGRK